MGRILGKALLAAQSGGQRVELPGSDVGEDVIEKAIEESKAIVQEKEKKEGFACPDCTFVAKSAIGLKSHSRKHK